MTWVKVCGITSIEARDAAIDAGADALGFVLVDGSPRRLDVPAAAALIASATIPAYVLVAGLGPDEALDTALRCGATGIQPYGDATDAVVRMAIEEGLDVLRPVAVTSSGPVDDPSALASDALVLFDTADPGTHGGTGRTFAWDAVAGVTRPFVLAGGLGPDNVARAIETARPFGVDASSRLETSPGVKDPDTIRAFVQEAKAT